jgi:hypothetical protein
LAIAGQAGRTWFEVECDYMQGYCEAAKDPITRPRLQARWKFQQALFGKDPQLAKGTNSKGAFSYSSLPPVTPADLPILRRHLSQGPKKLCVLATGVASMCGRSDEVRQMRWQDVILAEGLWLYGCSVAYHS